MCACACVCVRGGGGDRLTATWREVPQYVGRVCQTVILCDADLFEQPAGSHQHSYVKAEWSASKDTLREDHC